MADPDSDAMLRHLRRDFPLVAQVTQQQVEIDRLRSEVARLKAELAARAQPTRIGGTVFHTNPPPGPGAAATVTFTRPPAT